MLQTCHGRTAVEKKGLDDKVAMVVRAYALLCR